MKRAWLVVAAVISVSVAHAQEPSEGAESEVVVIAPDREEVTNFVGAVGAASRGELLARWDRGICPSVIGMPEAYAQAMIGRIAETARQLDLDVGSSGCEANVVIVATRYADELARNLAAEPAMHVTRDDTTLGRQALDAFANSPRAVRWWYFARTTTANGDYVPSGASPFSMPQTVTVPTASHIRSFTRQDLYRAYVIVDAQRIDGVRLDTLSDYIAMVTLAQIDPGIDADTVQHLPSILTLFAHGALNREAPTSLTTWDMAYLEGLYRANRYALHREQQESQIARSMMVVDESSLP